MDKGLEILAKVKRELGVPVLTDVHREDEIARRGGGRRRAADAGVPVPPDRLHPRRRAERQARQHQEGPVPRPARHEERARQGARRGTRRGPLRRPLPRLRARRELRLQQPRLRHAQPRDHARDERAGRVRRDPLGAASRRPGHVVGRPARVRAGARARGGRGRRRRHLHGDAPEPGRGALATGRTRCRSSTCSALLEQLAELDRAIKSRPLLEHSFEA